MKLFNISENNQDSVNWKNTEFDTFEQEMLWTINKQRAAKHEQEILLQRFDLYKKHLVKSWNGKFPIPVSHKAEVQHQWFGMPEGTPNGDKIWKEVEFYINRIEHARKLAGKYERLVAKIKKEARTKSLEKLKKAPNQIIPSADVPRRIYYSHNHYFNNPYWDNGENIISHYAGSVGHFSGFNKSEQHTLAELNQTLIRYGLGGMDKMYGVSFKPDYINQEPCNKFVAFGADGRLIWKCNYGNIVYIDGKQVSILDVASTPTTKLGIEIQKRQMDKLKLPYLPENTNKKLHDLVEHDLSDFEQPNFSDADKSSFIITKIKSLNHQKVVLITRLNYIDDLFTQDKMTPKIHQEKLVIEKKLAHVDNLLKQFNVVIGGTTLRLPLITCDNNLYVGPPEQYPELSNLHKKTLASLQTILTQAGIPQLSIMYAGQYSSTYPGTNWLATNQDRTFVWRKYDTSPGSGSNFVYFFGAWKEYNQLDKLEKLLTKTIKPGMVNTSLFIQNPEKYLPQLNNIKNT